MHVLKLGWVGLGFAVLNACSGSDTTTVSAPQRTADVSAVRAQLKPVLDASCGWTFKCCTDSERESQLGPVTSSDCTDHLIQSATLSYAYGLPGNQVAQNLLGVLNFVQFGFDYHNVTIDSAAIAACAAQLAAADCAALPPKDHCEPKAVTAGTDACQLDKLIVGKLAAGATCDAVVNECQPGLFCRSVSDHGVCIPKPVVGDLCLHDQDCGELLCDYGTGKCVSGAGAGQPCAFFDPDFPVPGSESVRCAADLACDTVRLKCTDPGCFAGMQCGQDSQCPEGVQCVMNRCGPLKQDGERCYTSNDCEHGVCGSDQQHQSQVCLALKTDGAGCQGSDQCKSGFCKLSGASQVCAPTVADGMPCMGVNEECTSGKCGAGMCVAVKAGDVCASDSDCAPSHDLYCVDLACTKAPLPAGAPCFENAKCASNTCAGGVCVAPGKVGAKCGASEQPPCNAQAFCEIPSGKSQGSCVAKKNEGESCTHDGECVNGCAPNRGQLRCNGQLPGTAMCSGK